LSAPASGTTDFLDAFLANWSDASAAWGTSLGGRVLRREDAVAVYAGRPAFVANAVTLRSPLVPTGIDDLMQALDAHYGFPTGERTGRVLIFSAWPTPDLSQYGWTLLGDAPLMLRQPGGEIPESRSGLRVVAVRDETSLRHAELVTVRGFGIRDPEIQGPGGLFGSALLDDERMRMWVGYAGDTPVTTSACYVSAGITNVINVATLPEARGRGYGSEVTWHATLTGPFLPSLLIASEQGRPVYERMGFSTIRQFTLLSRTSP
jgi:GNAT superfamily N-acetyltransferase